jgi:hypothetical protein
MPPPACSWEARYGTRSSVSFGGYVVRGRRTCSRFTAGGPLMFRTLPRQQFGQVQGKTFPHYFRSIPLIVGYPSECKADSFFAIKHANRAFDISARVLDLPSASGPRRTAGPVRRGCPEHLVARVCSGFVTRQLACSWSMDIKVCLFLDYGSAGAKGSSYSLSSLCT